MPIGPISLFSSVKSNRVADCTYLNFDEFVKVMLSYSHDKFASKSDAPLICLTEFKDGLRRKANANQSGMLVLDIDDHLSIEEVDAILEEDGHRALLCNTASHRPNTHKFRVFVPLSEVADYVDHTLAWHVANIAIADGKADPSKIGAESMFFVPGIYPDAPYFFKQYDGKSLSAEEWIELYGSRSEVEVLSGHKTVVKTAKERNWRSKSSLQAPSNADLDLARSRLVTDKSIEMYHNPSGPYHHARFKLLMSIAGRARRLDIETTAPDLVLLFNQIDLEDGGFYQTTEYQKTLMAEATKALSST